MVTFLKDVFHLFFAGMYRCYDFFDRDNIMDQFSLYLKSLA